MAECDAVGLLVRESVPNLGPAKVAVVQGKVWDIHIKYNSGSDQGGSCPEIMHGVVRLNNVCGYAKREKNTSVQKQGPTKGAVVLKEKTSGSYQEGGCPEAGASQKGEGW